MLTLYSFVDRDMVMQYEWGLGIGHTYSWKNLLMYRQVPDSGAGLSESEEESNEPNVDLGGQPFESKDEAAFCLNDRENEDLGSEESGEEASEGEASDDGE